MCGRSRGDNLAEAPRSWRPQIMKMGLVWLQSVSSGAIAINPDSRLAMAYFWYLMVMNAREARGEIDRVWNRTP